MSEFREALAAALDPWFVFTAADGKPGIAVRTGEELADLLLATPEMQAIRQDLRDKYARWVKAQWVFNPPQTALSSDLPESIEKWIMEEES